MPTQTQFRDQIVAAHPYVRGPHDAGDSEFFQESVFLCWADHRAGVGGFQRIGQEVNRGLANQWTAAYGPDGTRFRRLHPELELHDEWRRAEQFSAAGVSTCHFAGDSSWTVRHDDYEADLELHDLYPFTPFYAAGKESASDWATDPLQPEEFQPRHWEAASRITGNVRLGGQAYEIDGFAIRDHSFGFRDWSMIRNHRALVGTFGPQFSFSMLVWHTGPDDVFSRYAYVNRNGEEEWTDDCEIVVAVEPDGITFRRGEAILRMPSGAEHHIVATPVAGFLMPHREYIAVDNSCVLTCGELKDGYGDLELSINPYDGRRHPTFSLGTTIGDGLIRPPA